MRVRERLARRLDDFIASRRPFCSVHQARDLLLGRSRYSRDATYLDPISLDLASRLIPLLFARRTRRHYKRWLSIRATPANDKAAPEAIVVRHPPLTARSTAAPEDDHPRRARNGCVLAVGAMHQRLAQIHPIEARPHAVCRLTGGGMVVEVTARMVSWGSPGAILTTGTLAGRSLLAMGLTCDYEIPALRLTASMPEAIIQLSACLSRGEVMDLPAGGPLHAQKRVLVGLRDFDGDEGVLPARLNHAGSEGWLDRLPPMSLDVSLSEAAAIASWAYVPAAWATPALLRDFMAREASGAT
jgi:hypothetical protein